MSQNHRYFEDSALVFGALQSAPDDYPTLQGADALACVELGFKPVHQMDTYTYAGSVTDRSEENLLVDRYGTLNTTCFLPVASIAGQRPAMNPWLEACRVKVTDEADKVIYSNEELTEAVLYQHFRRSRAALDQDKVFHMKNSIVQLGATFEMHKRVMLTMDMMGESEVSEMLPHLAEDYQGQKTKVAPLMTPENVSLMWDIHEICPHKIEFQNLFGLDITRFLVECQKGFDVKATPSDISLTILEKDSDVPFNPEKLLGQTGELELILGEVAGVDNSGKIVELSLSETTVVDWQPTSVDEYAGMTVQLRNIGTTKLTFR